jgi:Putative Flp pilus-assembly TadE/G-like
VPTTPSSLGSGSRLRQEKESGQVVVLVAVMLVALLGFAAVAIDVGYAYYAQRSLQASADAAALAGAQGLPDTAKAKSLALEYSGGAGGKNLRSNLKDVQTDVSLECVPVGSGTSCVSTNAVIVGEHAKVNSFFARVLGVDAFTVSARAAACSQGATLVYLIDENGPCPLPAGPPIGFTSAQRLTPNDLAIVTAAGGGPTPTGTVLFQLFGAGDASCSGTPQLVDTEPLSGGQAKTLNTSVVASLAGTWRWKVHYGGDSNYKPVDSACGVENFTISN